jgi:hypothetical protein
MDIDTSAKSCLICINNIEPNDYVWYTIEEIINESNYQQKWTRFPYCIDCVNYLKSSLWDKYVMDLKKSDCEKSLRHIIESGPPGRVRDAFIASNQEIYAFKVNDQIISSDLDGAPSVEKLLELKQKLVDVLIILDKHKNMENNIDSEDLVDIMNVVCQIFNEY